MFMGGGSPSETTRHNFDPAIGQRSIILVSKQNVQVTSKLPQVSTYKYITINIQNKLNGNIKARN